MKKILVTYEHGLGGDTIGGGQRILFELINQLKRDHEVTLITPKTKGKINEAIWNGGIKIIYSRYSKVAFLSGLLIFLQYLKIKGFKYNLTIAFTSEIYWLSLMRKLIKFKIASYLAAPDLTGFKSGSIIKNLITIRKRFELYLFMKGFSDADLKLAIGNKIKNEAEFKFNIKNIKVIYPGVNYSYIKKSRSKSSNLINILYIGRLDFKQKPLNQLIEAIEITSDIVEKFHVIGNGPDYTYLEKIKNNKRLTL